MSFPGHAILAVAALLGTGCTQRTLLVTSEPPGARLFVNGREAGVTPHRVPWVHPGRVDLRLEKDGYRSVAEEVTTPRTFDTMPGPDFFAENLNPGGLRRETSHHVVLTPLPSAPSEGDLAELLRRASAFRARAESETAGPDTPAPTRADRTGAPPPSLPPVPPPSLPPVPPPSLPPVPPPSPPPVPPPPVSPQGPTPSNR